MNYILPYTSASVFSPILYMILLFVFIGVTCLIEKIPYVKKILYFLFSFLSSAFFDVTPTSRIEKAESSVTMIIIGL